MHDNRDMIRVRQGYLLTNDLLSNALFVLIEDVLDDRMASVEEHHRREYHPLDQLDRTHTTDYRCLIVQSSLRLVLSKLSLLR